MTKTDEDLIAAARAVVERWDTPHWKDVPATAVFINRLRNALCDRLEGRGGGEVVALPDGRDMCGETVMGMRVAAYRQPIRCPPDVDLRGVLPSRQAQHLQRALVNSGRWPAD
jgi:hypothetical protein